MIPISLKLIEELNKHQFKFKKSAFNKIINDYNFILISKEVLLNNQEKEKDKNILNIKNSKLFVIDLINSAEQNSKEIYMIICFEKTLLILEKSYISYFYDILTNNSDLFACFLPNTKNQIIKLIKIQNKEILHDEYFTKEIENFKNDCYIINSPKKIINFWQNISTCIIGYLIKKCYLERNKNRIEQYIFDLEKDPQIIEIDENDYVELRQVGSGTFSKCKLIYHLERGEFYVAKFLDGYTEETLRLIEREKSNYLKCHNAFLPKYIGTLKSNGFIVIEFINGRTLNKIELSNINKTKIIFELLLIIKYFHDNNLIYRDLKPNNIMIDNNQNVVLIDLDRLIRLDDNSAQSLDLSHIYVDSEIEKTGSFSFGSDIYSLGMVIRFIMDQNKENDKIIQLCINKNLQLRPTINELIYGFIDSYQSKVQIENFTTSYKGHFSFFDFINRISLGNDHKYLYFGIIYFNGSYVKKDINKANHFFALFEKQIDLDAQKKLGIIYYEGEYVTKDISKAVHYFTHAQNQNDPEIQFYLGMSYINNQYDKRDANKAIQYLKLSANQNNKNAQSNLGIYYYTGEYVGRDINKAINYLSLAANQNHLYSQSTLGLIYYEGKYIQRDINKAIHYLSLAANQNCPNAQFNLAAIYMNGEYVQKDVNKAIHYYSLAANQNLLEAQNNLGMLYYKGEYIQRDINKAIFYFTAASNNNHCIAQYYLSKIYFDNKNIDKTIYYSTLSANQNYSPAQYFLGYLYYSGDFVKMDIQKSLYYMKLAADQNYSRAQTALGFLYNEGKYVKHDYMKSIFYFKLAANQNDSEAQFNLGIFYIEGKDIMPDVNIAIHYFLLAANQDHPGALCNLGIIFYEDIYIKRDINKAIYYFTKAADKNEWRAHSYLGKIYIEEKYIKCDVNKAIKYFSILANQDYEYEQYNLGLIYYYEKYQVHDIYKAIHYLSLAANNKMPKAQNFLGIIFYEGKYIQRDIKKAIHYFTLASNQNEEYAQYNLGIIFYEGKYIIQNVNKAVHYFTLSASHNYSEAQFYLGQIFYEGKYVQRDINKAVDYFTLASNQNHSVAQFKLGLIYYLGEKYTKNIEKGKIFLIIASKNGNREANFAHGFLLHEGKNVERNIEEAIHYYKEASSFNNQYAKNNLGIIYKNGFEDIVKKRIGDAIIFFEEAIRQKNDYLSMYNLANIYIYDESIKHDINKSIELLIKSADKFYHSLILLCLVLIKQYGFDHKKIKEKIDSLNDKKNDLSSKVFKMMILISIEENELPNNKKNDLLNDNNKMSICIEKINKSCFDNLYNSYREKDFLYNIQNKPIQSSSIQKIDDNNGNAKRIPHLYNLSSVFYEGFGYDIL